MNGVPAQNTIHSETKACWKQFVSRHGFLFGQNISFECAWVSVFLSLCVYFFFIFSSILFNICLAFFTQLSLNDIMRICIKYSERLPGKWQHVNDMNARTCTFSCLYTSARSSFARSFAHSRASFSRQMIPIGVNVNVILTTEENV